MASFLTFLKQCDLARPACSRCRRLGLRCEYLVRQQGQVFINRSVAHPFVKAVDIFSNGGKTKLPEDLYLNPATPARARHNRSLRHPIPRSPDSEPAYRMQLLSKFIEIYFPRATHVTTRAGQTPASWVHVLPDITLTNPAYNASLAALCVAQLGIWNHDSVLGKESHQLYGSALGELRKTIGSIGCRRLVAPEATVASIVILSTYEVSCVVSRIRTESKLSCGSNFQVRQGRAWGGCTSGVDLPFYSFLGAGSVKLLSAVSSSRKYEPSR